jgi:phospholipase/carboxylesterase
MFKQPLPALKIWSKALSLLLLLLAGSFLSACSSNRYTLTYSAEPYYFDSPSPYYLYLPKSYTPEKEWPLFVGIHGFNGDGNYCLGMWQEKADEEGYILVCPSLADESGGWYVEEGEAKLNAVLTDVRRQVHAQKQLFLTGFSAGAEFALNYTLDQPKNVKGVAVLSCNNYFPPWKNSQRGPAYLVIIGDRDQPAGVNGAREFASLLEQEDYNIQFELLPGIGHEFTPQALEDTMIFYEEVMSDQ